MQNKYLSALRTKYASFGLSKEALDRVALQRVKTITTEDEIESDIAGTDTMFLVMKEMQGSVDALRSKAAQAQKELEALKATSQSQPVEPEPENPLAKEVAEMKAMMASMTAEIAESKKKAHTEAVLNEVHAKMKAMGCTNDYIRKTTLLGLEFSETDTADSLAEKYKSVYDENCKSAFGNGYVPPMGNNQGGKDEVDYSAMVEGLKKTGAFDKK